MTDPKQSEPDEKIPVVFWATREELNHYHMTRSITLLEPRLYRAILHALARKEQPWEGWEDAKGVVEAGAADNCKHVLVVPLED